MAIETKKWKQKQAEALAALAEVRSVEEQLRTRHSALLRERREVENAQPPMETVLANIDRLVDHAGAEWRKKYTPGVVRDLAGHIEFPDRPGGHERPVAPRLPRLGPLEGYLTLQDLSALAPDLVKANLKRTVKESGGTFGLAPAERSAKLAELAREITEVETQHTELALEAGLDLLPVVKERKDAEALASRRAADLAAERKRGVAVDDVFRVATA